MCGKLPPVNLGCYRDLAPSESKHYEDGKIQEEVRERLNNIFRSQSHALDSLNYAVKRNIENMNLGKLKLKPYQEKTLDEIKRYSYKPEDMIFPAPPYFDITPETKEEFLQALSREPILSFDNNSDVIFKTFNMKPETKEQRLAEKAKKEQREKAREAVNVIQDVKEKSQELREKIREFISFDNEQIQVSTRTQGCYNDDISNDNLITDSFFRVNAEKAKKEAMEIREELDGFLDSLLGIEAKEE